MVIEKKNQKSTIADNLFRSPCAFLSFHSFVVSSVPKRSRESDAAKSNDAA